MHVNENIAISLLGSFSSGKSYLASHLVFLTHPGRRRRQFFDYLWAVDSYREERSRAMTIGIHHLSITTSTRKVLLINSPGHRDYIKNTIVAIQQSDCAILVVSSIQGQFQQGIAPSGTTKDHALLSYIFGNRQLIVCCSKIDDKRVDYSERIFAQITEKTSHFLSKIGYKSQKITFIPVSGQRGDNLAERSSNTPWYKGPTILEAFDNLVAPKRQNKKPLRLSVHEIFKIAGVGNVVVGTILTGSLKIGMEVACGPEKIKSTIQSIQINNQTVKKAGSGSFIGLKLKGITQKNIHRGDIISDFNHKHHEKVKSFVARIIILDHPGSLKVGYTPVISCHAVSVACKITEIQKTINKKSGIVIQKHPAFIKKGDCAIVVMEPIKTLVLEVFDEFPSLGSFAIRDNSRIVGVGVVEQIKRKYSE